MKPGMDRLAEHASAVASTMGLLHSRHGDSSSFRVTPFTLLPTAVPPRDLRHALRVAPLFNKVLMAAAADTAFLREELQATAAADPQFVGRLVALLPSSDDVNDQGIQLAVNRYDFFVDACVNTEDACEQRGLRLVERNCMAPAGVADARIVAQLHAAVLDHPVAAVAGANISPRSVNVQDVDGNVTATIARAHALFTQAHKDVVPPGSARVVMVVIPPFQMWCDHNAVQQKAWTRHGLDVVRMTLADIVRFGAIDGDGHLQVCGFAGIEPFVVSVAYFCTGYMPADYPTENEWKARWMLENSSVACCPSVGMHLIGLKKMQQVLGEDGVLERYLTHEEAQAVRSTLVREWDASDDDAMHRATGNPDGYVMKPQREGGGNNLFGADLATTLARLSSQQRAGFTLMQRIHPGVTRNIMVRDGRGVEMDVHSELQVFSTIVSVDGEVGESQTAGCSVKSKSVDVDEGGINIGAGAIGSTLILETLERFN